MAVPDLIVLSCLDLTDTELAGAKQGPENLLRGSGRGPHLDGALDDASVMSV
jgi:hypothetical protein